MQLTAKTTVEPGLEGGIADSGPKDVFSSTAIETIPFGRVVAYSGSSLALVLNTAITTGTIDFKVNGTAITQVTFTTDHLTTMNLIAAAVDAILGTGSASVGGTSNLTLTITGLNGTAPTVSNWVSSQGVTVTHTLNTTEELARLPRQNAITIQLAGAMVTGDTISGYLNGNSTLLTTTFAGNSTTTTLTNLATLIKAEPGIKDATVGTNNITVTADNHSDVTAAFTSTTQAITYVEDCTDTFMGISALEAKEAGTANDAQYEDGDTIGIARKGRRFIRSAAALAPNQAIYVRFAPTPAADRGKITDAPGSNPVVAKLWTGMIPKKTSAAGALAVVDLNQP